VDFTLDEASKKLQADIAEFAKKELPEGFIRSISIEQEYQDFEFEMAMSKKLAQRGWLTMSWPKEYGGGGAGYFEQTVYEMETHYHYIPGVWMGVSGIQWVGPVLMSIGTEEQKKKYIPMIASGEKDGVWCTGYSEPNAGSDLANLQTRAVRTGDRYIINGQKVWTSKAHHARWCWLLARTVPMTQKKHHGLSLIIVDMRSPGITVRPILNFYGKHHFNEVFFDNVEVPAANLVGTENRGWYHLMEALVHERRSFAPCIYGSSKRVVEELVECVRNTKHEGKPLSQNISVRNQLASIAIDLESLKLFAFQITWLVAQGGMPIYEASRNKLLADHLGQRIALTGAEILGAYSQIDPDAKLLARFNGDIQGWYLGFPGGQIAAGTSEVEKSVIAQFKLGLPKSY
jgi:alkylation response protein AidB-like acyl-CoA dehydrogenase